MGKLIELYKTSGWKCFFVMIRRPPRSTRGRSSAASDVYKRQDTGDGGERLTMTAPVLSCRLADFVNSVPEGEGTVVIGARRFVVNGVEKTGHQDCRLILTERTV